MSFSKELFMSEGLKRIAAELHSQRDKGYTPEHDAEHRNRELSKAALCYLQGKPWIGGAWSDWPWEPESWKPSDDPVRNLEKAGALIAAEIDRLLAERSPDAVL